MKSKPYVAFPGPEPPYENAWAETRDLNPTDRRIRKHGFQIAAWPAKGEPCWCLGPWRPEKPVYTQSEVLLRIEDE